jgi:asparagine synthase (glutamine-hydrolysing)
LKLSENSEKKPIVYWKPKVELDEEMTYNQAVDRTREALINAVNLRMRSDVPLAFCMSGGIDSNALISIAKRELGCDVHGFTIVNTDSRYEESDLVKESVKELDIEHTYLKPKHDGFLENMHKLVHSHDGPLCTISYYVHWKLMESVAAQGYKVSISGTGADELFTGYYDHHNLYLYEVSNNQLLYKESLDAWEKYQRPIVRNPFLQDPELFIKSPSFRKYKYLNNDIFEKFLQSKWNEDFTENDYGCGLLRTRMLNEMFVEGVRVILKDDDLNAMYFSIENRSPFLDKQLFQTAYSIPTEHLIKNGFAKSVLRDSMRGIVPNKILNNRTKVGFNAPILDLLNLKDPNVINFLLDDSEIFTIVKKEKIKDLLKQKQMTNSFSKFLFNFINAKIFIDT